MDTTRPKEKGLTAEEKGWSQTLFKKIYDPTLISVSG
jgi:hypothetical protein